MRRMSQRLLIGLAVLGVMAGCASSPSARFYALNTLAAAPQAVQRGDLAIALGPIDLPTYLDRPQIVTRSGGNRLSVDEFNRWGGLLEEEIGRLMADYLGRRLGTERIYSYPSRVAPETRYRVAIDIRRLDGGLGGEVVLDAAWSLIDERSGAVVKTRQQSYRETVATPDYDAYVAGLSSLIGRLAGDAAGAAA